MNTDGHLAAAEEFRVSMAALQPSGDHIRLYAEAGVGRALHLRCVGAQRRFQVHREQHEGLMRWLRERDEGAMADVFLELESIRTGRWFGRQGNGDVAERLDQLLQQIAAWAMA